MKPATPLPWVIDGHAVIGSNSLTVCDAEQYYPHAVDAEDAAYIVHACNAYPQLVAALRRTLNRIDAAHFNNDRKYAIRDDCALVLHQIGEAT